MICSPSFLSCDFSKLESEILSISESKWIHFDVMDGLFVNNTTYDHAVLNRIKKISSQFFDCHLMINKPEKYYLDYIKAGADLITFHYEATNDCQALIKAIKAKGVKVGISIKPETNVSVLESFLQDLDLILIMSVEPGKGGQKFLEGSLKKIEYLNDKRTCNGYKYLIEVDGGINFDTAKLVKAVGNDVIVVGSFIFNKQNRNELVKELENV
jgi:ribulose-phosphate 3-epimerase